VAAQTRLSHVDGQNGVLIIGGYSVEELASHAGLEAAAHLLWRGRLPDRVELRELVSQMARLRQLKPLTIEVLRAAKSAPPIDALRMACATLSLDLADPNAITPEADFTAAMRLTACFPTIPRPRRRWMRIGSP
jgi:citrate synthase